jgi:hypothetical protein
VILADALPDTGAGHVMRMGVLAAAWAGARLGPTALVGRVAIPFVQRRLAQLGVSTRHSLGDVAGAVLAVDSYAEEARREAAACSSASLRVLVDDAGGPVPTGIDLVWNPNAYGGGELYPGFRGAVVGGTDAVPIRTGLPTWAGGTPRTVAVFLGGGRVGATLTDAITELAGSLPQSSFRGAGEWVPKSWTQVDPDRVWDGLAGASVLITAAGSSIWEAATVGIPVVALCAADNQVLVWQWAAAAGVPGVDVRRATTASAVAEELRRALPRARPLPPLRNGAPAVARALHKAARPGDAAT